jgi:hypothetical protein
MDRLLAELALCKEESVIINIITNRINDQWLWPIDVQQITVVMKMFNTDVYRSAMLSLFVKGRVLNCIRFEPLQMPGLVAELLMTFVTRIYRFVALELLFLNLDFTEDRNGSILQCLDIPRFQEKWLAMVLEKDFTRKGSSIWYSPHSSIIDAWTLRRVPRSPADDPTPISFDNQTVRRVWGDLVAIPSPREVGVEDVGAFAHRAPILPRLSHGGSYNLLHVSGRPTPPVIIPPDVPVEGTEAHENELNKCSICWVNRVDAMFLDCTHLFCGPCIRAHMSSKTTCPTCRGHIKSVKRVYLAFLETPQNKK